jgi:hypothetical protein
MGQRDQGVPRSGAREMKVALPQSLALKVADYLEKDVARLEGSYWHFGKQRVEPRHLRLEVERLRKWVAQIRAAAEPGQS